MPELKVLANALHQEMHGAKIYSIGVLKGPYAIGIDVRYEQFRNTINKLSALMTKREIRVGMVVSMCKYICIELLISACGDIPIYICVKNAKLAHAMSTHSILELIFTDNKNPTITSRNIRNLYIDDSRSNCVIDIYTLDELNTLRASLGPDPSEITLKQFHTNVNKYPNKPIVDVISNDKVIGGIGNIYRCEALYIAKINPLVLVKNLTEKQITLLHAAIKFVTLGALVSLRGDGEPVRYVYGLTITAKAEPVSVISLSRRQIWFVSDENFAAQ